MWECVLMFLASYMTFIVKCDNVISQTLDAFWSCVRMSRRDSFLFSLTLSHMQATQSIFPNSFFRADQGNGGGRG